MTPYGPALAQSNTVPTMMMNHSGDMGAMHEVMSALKGEMPAIHNQVTAAVAAKLDLTAEELQQALQSGKTLATQAEEKGIAADAVKGAMVGAMQQALTDLVKAGKLDTNVAAKIRGLIPKHAETCLTMNMANMHGMMGH